MCKEGILLDLAKWSTRFKECLNSWHEKIFLKNSIHNYGTMPCFISQFIEGHWYHFLASWGCWGMEVVDFAVKRAYPLVFSCFGPILTDSREPIMQKEHG